MCGNVDIKPAVLDQATPETASRTDKPIEFFPVNMKDKAAAVGQLSKMSRKLQAVFSFMPVTHTFGDGLYTRTANIKAGLIIVGAKHKAENIFHFSRGACVVWDRFHGIRLLRAPFSEITRPGTQRLGFVVEDLTVCNIFRTETKNWEQAEAEMGFPFIVPANAGEKLFNLLQFVLEKKLCRLA